MFRQLVTPEYNELAICATAHALANLGKNYARWRQDPYCGRYFPEGVDLGKFVRDVGKLLQPVVGFEFLDSHELKTRTNQVKKDVDFEEHYAKFPIPPEFTDEDGEPLVVTSICIFNK
jgi:hypothetical protein